MASQNSLPEGTDTLVDDGTTGDTERETGSSQQGGSSQGSTSQGHQSSGDAGTSSGSGGSPRGAFSAFKQAAADGTEALRSQAGEHARNYAAQGKDRASDALTNLAKMVTDAAGQVEEKIGPEYAGYARKAADAVNGAADSLRSKNVDELIEDAKDYVKASPALAIGIAAALGFVVARVARAGVAGESNAGPDEKA